MKTKNSATLFAVLAAALYAINVPISKILLEHVDATMMAGLLYLGAGVGMLSNKSSEEIVIIKGCLSGLGSLVIALILSEGIPAVKWIAAVLVLGFVSY